VSFASFVIILWTLIGGLRGVAITDAIQGLFMVCAAFMGIVWAGGRYGGLELHRFPSEFWTPARFINFTLPWFFFALTNPQVVQRLFIPKDEHSFKRMVLFFGLYGFIYTLIVTGIGFYARHGAAGGLFPLVQDRDRVIIEILGRMHTWLSISLALSIVFASVSTANSIILTLSSMVSRNIFRTRKNIVVGKSFLFILTGLVFLFSIYRPYYIVELAVSSSSILLCTLLLFFGIFYWKKGGRRSFQEGVFQASSISRSNT
jgi:SSS family solute:Na+ symporter